MQPNSGVYLVQETVREQRTILTFTLKVFSLVLHPLTSCLSSSQVGIVKSQDFDMSQKTHILYSWSGRIFCWFFFFFFLCICRVYVLACTWTHTHTHTYTYPNSDSPLQRSLPETRVHYCSLTSASSLTSTGFSPSVWPFCVCCH